MYLFGFYLARYVDWCEAVSKAAPRWKIFLAGAAFFVFAIGLMFFAPAVIGGPVLVCGGVPVSVFFGIDQRIQRQRVLRQQETQAQLRKTRKLLKGFRK
ncbi:hypothetical protein TRM7557_02067 [Tritonibacter multivorans]|uniref:Transmembrane protein n=1 Tax=Tritonibacter multivorans TaxID=928856 RepID=A0A0P1GUN8_9RHOB|nr:hypothetical protein [Tritonibacter multivorans]MDA7421407.1 hypothetical protein [Tritonibacter multivorans]CUH78840.1 hypothetical protein TRM7557_02067 [Tritonibacter multivorans]SFD28782.1 hypothetical protein SAMN04488049_110119 [Tritonibacter multivorans]